MEIPLKYFKKYTILTYYKPPVLNHRVSLIVDPDHNIFFRQINIFDAYIGLGKVY